MAGSTKKGKQCPGGYWIPRDKKCGKSGKAGSKGRSSGLKLPFSTKMPEGAKGARNAAIGIAAAAGLGGAALYGVSRMSEEGKKRSRTKGEVIGEGVRKQMEGEARGKKGDREVVIADNMFVDMYPRWDSCHGCWS